MISILSYRTVYPEHWNGNRRTITVMSSVESWITVKEDHGCDRCCNTIHRCHKYRYGFPGVVWKDVMS